MADKQQLVIAATPREILGKKVRTLRNEGVVPAVLYGHGLESRSISVLRSDFDKMYREAGESTIVQVAVEGIAPVNVLIQDVQRHGTRGDVMHVDFYEVKMNEKLTATVPLVFVGEAPAVKMLGGTLTHAISEVEIESLPANLPSEIEVDVSGLATFEDSLRVEDIKIDRSKVEILTDAEQVIASVQEPRSDADMDELNAAPTENIAEVEGIKKEDEAAVVEGEDKKE
jgi:large subunit ribosomal protein L25